MNELLLVAWLHTVGVMTLWCLFRLPISLAATAGFVVATAVYVLIASLILLVSLPFTPVAAAALMTIVVASGTIKYWRFRPRSGTILAPAGFGIALLLTAALAESLNLGKLSFDSFQMIEMGSILAQTGELSELPSRLLLARPLFLPIVHTLAEPLGRFYLHTFAPVFGVGAIGTVAWMTHEVLRIKGIRHRPAIGFTLLALGALFSSYFVIFQFFYVNGHLILGLYLAFYVVAVWLAAVTGSDRWALLGVFILYAAVLLRLESPLILTLFLVPLLAMRDITKRMKWLHGSVFIASVAAWFGVVIGGRGGGGEISSDWSVPVMLGATGLFGLIMLFHETTLARWSLERINWLAPGGALVGVVATVVLKPAHMLDSLDASIENIWVAGNWGVTWLILLPLAVLALIYAPWKHPLWFVPIATFIPVTYALSFGRVPYRVEWGDSGNRMLTHILPLLVMFVVICAASLINYHADERRSASIPPEDLAS